MPARANGGVFVALKTAAGRVQTYLGPVQFGMIAYTFQLATYDAVSAWFPFWAWVVVGLTGWVALGVLVAWLDWRFVFTPEYEIYRDRMGLK